MIVTPVAVADLNLLSKALNTELDGILGQDVLSQFSRVTGDNGGLAFELFEHALSSGLATSDPSLWIT